MNVVTEVSGPVTVAAVVPEAGSMAEGLGMFFGVAVCSPKDLNVKAVGERIATARAMAELAQAMEEEAVASVVTKEEAFWADVEDHPDSLIELSLKMKGAKVPFAKHIVTPALARDFIEHQRSYGMTDLKFS